MNKDIPYDLVLLMGEPASQVANVKDIELPAISYKVEEFATRASMPGIELPVGMEPMTLSFTLEGYNKEVLKAVGFSQGNNVPFTINGVLINANSQRTNWKCYVTGFIKTINKGTFDMTGGKSEVSVEVALSSYKEVHGGETIINIDSESQTFEVNGKNQLGDLT